MDIQCCVGDPRRLASHAAAFRQSERRSDIADRPVLVETTTMKNTRSTIRQAMHWTSFENSVRLYPVVTTSVPTWCAVA